MNGWNRHCLLLAALLGVCGCAGTMPRAFVAGSLKPGMRIAILPLANYTDRQDASDRVVPLLALEIARQRGVSVVDPGQVEEIFSREPWLLLDRIPPELIEKFGAELGADAFLVGSVLAYGYRDVDTDAVPEVSVALRLLLVHGGGCLWSGIEARAGNDRESVFGIGRVDNLESLAAAAIRDLVKTFPSSRGTPAATGVSQKREQEK
jgi:hypothetical protein